jgi:hypothetical protein
MNKSAIFLIANRSILNPDKIEVFENLTVHYSIYLNSLLYLNWIELISALGESYDVYYCMNKSDEEYIPKNFLPNASNLVLLNITTKEKLRDSLRELELKRYSKFLFAFFNSMGIKKEDICKTFNLLTVDDQAITVGKADNERIAFVGTNKIEENLLTKLSAQHAKYNNFLNEISREDVFLHTINNFFSINNFQDVKKLYIELSKKESLSFCSENMHERFNDLFVEYKYLLNE